MKQEKNILKLHIFLLPVLLGFSFGFSQICFAKNSNNFSKKNYVDDSNTKYFNRAPQKPYSQKPHPQKPYSQKAHFAGSFMAHQEVTQVISHAQLSNNSQHPESLYSKEEERQILKSFANQTLKSFINSKNLKNSFLMVFYKKMEQNLNADIVFKPKTGSGLNHRFAFNVNPFQVSTSITYRGYFDGQLHYQLDQKNLSFKYEKRLPNDMTIALKTNWSPIEDTNLLHLAWGW